MESDAERLWNCADELLKPFAAPGGRNTRRVRLCYRTVEESGLEGAGLKCCWRDRLPGGVLASGWARGELRGLCLQEMGTMLLDLTEGKAELSVAPGRESCMNLGLLIPAVCDFLGVLGQHACHAACARLPGDGGRCALLFGASGDGKTTTVLALHNVGLRLMSDDCTILSDAAGERKVPMIWGFPRPCKVHRRTFELLGWLEEVVPDPTFVGDECVVPFARIAPVDVELTVEPALVLFLRARNPDSHRLESISPMQAVTELARRTVRAPGGQGLAQAADAFRAVTRLASSVPVMRLSVGPDLNSLGKLLLDVIGERT